ncbi:unnamed protein product, partial [Hapterophycus canaliculatus]
LDFDFRSPFPEEGCRGRKVSVRVQQEGVLDAVMMTWDLSLHGDVTYSTRPGAENWQDHWCPSYFPVCNQVHVRGGDLVHLKVTHSELNIMFEVEKVDTNSEQQQEEKRKEAGVIEVEGREWDPEPCGCGWHVLCNPERIGLPVAAESSTVLDIGDGAACAFLAAGEGAGAVISYEPAEWSHLLVGQVCKTI